jgi:hypothetical protein
VLIARSHCFFRAPPTCASSSFNALNRRSRAANAWSVAASCQTALCAMGIRICMYFIRSSCAIVHFASNPRLHRDRHQCAAARRVHRSKDLDQEQIKSLFCSFLGASLGRLERPFTGPFPFFSLTRLAIPGDICHVQSHNLFCISGDGFTNLKVWGALVCSLASKLLLSVSRSFVWVPPYLRVQLRFVRLQLSCQLHVHIRSSCGV